MVTDIAAAATFQHPTPHTLKDLLSASTCPQTPGPHQGKQLENEGMTLLAALAESCDNEYLEREVLRGQTAARCRRETAECSRSVCTVIPPRQ